MCDWSGVREDSLDMPACVKGICGGHRADDVLPFEVKVKQRSVNVNDWFAAQTPSPPPFVAFVARCVFQRL